MPTKNQFIKELNIALSWEYAAMVQYIQHAAIITGPQYDAIAKELLVHATEEMNHANMVAAAIADLDGTPTADVQKRETSANSTTMLKQDLKGEELAISIYKKLIKMANQLEEYGIRRVLEDILMQEEEHRRDILTSLAR